MSIGVGGCDDNGKGRGCWIADKHVHKVGEEVTREVTKKFRSMVGW